MLKAASLVVVLSLVQFLFAVAANAAALDADAGRVTIYIDDEPPSLNSMVSADVYSGEVLMHIMEGLTQYAPDGSLIPGVAERWTLDANGARFWLRRDAKWSDGKPVTAHDFVYAWRRVVTPATGSPYAFIFAPVKNSQAVVRGELPPERLGVRAVSDYELVVEFAQPCPYFISLTASMTFYPARRDAVEQWGRAYAADADKSIYNGPFVLQRWVHAAELVLQRNPHYWNRDAIKLNTIHYAYITKDQQAKYNLFRNGDIAYVVLNEDNLQSAIDAGYAIRQQQGGSLFYMAFNHRPERITSNLALRKAIQAVYDPDVVVNKLIGRPGNIPGRSLFPFTVKGHRRPFREEYPAPKAPVNLRAARAYLQQALDELGLQSLPPLDVLATDSELSQQQSEYLQELLLRALGIELRINKQSFKQYLAVRRTGSFDLTVGSGWGPDYDDAMTYGDLFASWNPNNQGRYNNAAYDAAVRRAQQTEDPQRRFAAFADMQRIIREDVVILPIYEEVENYAVHPRLRGLYRPVFGGDFNLRFAWIEE